MANTKTRDRVGRLVEIAHSIEDEAGNEEAVRTLLHEAMQLLGDEPSPLTDTERVEAARDLCVEAQRHANEVLLHLWAAGDTSPKPLLDAKTKTTDAIYFFATYLKEEEQRKAEASA